MGKSEVKPKSKIQESIDKAREEQRLDIYKKRIDFAKQGIKAFELGRNADAIKHFSTYLKILEEWKDTTPGGLTPAVFDRKKDVAEMLLINGIYLVLIKIYDRGKDANRKEFQRALEKYLVFSKGMPFQAVAADNLRKYTNNEKPIHKVEIMNAYKMIGGGGCFIVTALLDVSDPRTLPTLREFRDTVLEQTFVGQLFTRIYYRLSPPVAARLERCPGVVRKAIALGLDGIAAVVRRVY